MDLEIIQSPAGAAYLLLSACAALAVAVAFMFRILVKTQSKNAETLVGVVEKNTAAYADFASATRELATEVRETRMRDMAGMHRTSD